MKNVKIHKKLNVNRILDNLAKQKTIFSYLSITTEHK